MREPPISKHGGLSESSEDKPCPTRLVYRFAAFELDPSRHELRRRGMRMRIAPAPMDLLILLVERRGDLVTREQIASRLWAQRNMVDVDQGINTAIRRIREVLRDDPSEPRFIATAVGRGYRFLAEVEEARVGPILVSPLPSTQTDAATETVVPITEQPPFDEVDEPQIAPSPEPEPKRHIREYALVGAVLLVLVLTAAFAVWRHLKRKLAVNLTAITQVTTNDSEERVTAGAVSPDGRWLAYAGINGIYLQPLQNGKTLPLKGLENFRVERIAWFPDQTKILLSGFDTRLATPQIWMVFVVGGAPQLFRKNARGGVPSPDGATIAFLANNDREIWTAGAAGEDSHLLVTDYSGKAFSSLFWSADGKRLSYLRNLDGLWKADYESADASSGKILAVEKDALFDSACAMTDGRVFFLREAPPHFGGVYALWVVGTNRSTGAFIGQPRQVATLERGKASGLTASDDGSRMSIVFERGLPHVFVATLQQPGPVLAEIQKLTLDTQTAYPGSWLHDSQTVLFESDRTGIYRLYEQRLQDHNPVELAAGAGPSVLPQVTPDGKWILYAMSPDIVTTVKSRLFRLSTNGGEPEQVPLSGRLDEFRCPLVGGTTCVLRETEGEKSFIYYALDPVTGKGPELARTAWWPHVTSDWSVSSNGTEVALASHDRGNPRIRIVPLDRDPTHHERELPVSGFGRLSGISWSADGKGWYVAADTGAGTLILYVSQSGESHVLHDAPLSSWGVPSPDGRKLAFVDQAVDSNIWMWQTVPGR